MEMRSLYPVYLPVENTDEHDVKQYNDWVKKNENCLNRNFTLLTDKLFELETRLAAVENSSS